MCILWLLVDMFRPDTVLLLPECLQKNYSRTTDCFIVLEPSLNSTGECWLAVICVLNTIWIRPVFVCASTVFSWIKRCKSAAVVDFPLKKSCHTVIVQSLRDRGRRLLLRINRLKTVGLHSHWLTELLLDQQTEDCRASLKLWGQGTDWSWRTLSSNCVLKM